MDKMNIKNRDNKIINEENFYELSDNTDSNSTIITDTNCVDPSLYLPTCSKFGGNLSEDTYKPSSLNYCNPSKSPPDNEVEAIIKKYSTFLTNSFVKPETNACIELSSDEELPDISNTSQQPTNINNTTKICDNNEVKLLEKHNENDHENDIRTDTYESPLKKKHKMNTNVKQSKKTERLFQQNKKQEEIRRKKTIKQAISISKQNQKPEHCHKFITVLLDSNIAKEKYSDEILSTLQTIDITYSLQPQLIPYLITWNRTNPTPYLDENEQLSHTEEIIETNEALLVMNWKQIVELVYTHSLIAHIESLKTILTNKRLSIGIYGMENYFKYQKSQKNKEIQLNIGQPSTTKSNKYDKIYKDSPKISKKQLEFALTELQLVCSCCYRKLETSVDVGAIVIQFTKAIAQIPYKLEKQENYKDAKWYMAEDNKDCVRVDKNGNGLQRLWQQQITTFPLARLEHAEAIIAKYPTPISLMKEYATCPQIEGEKLLQDISIRRAAGPLTTIRKIGPELSKKIYKFFTTCDENIPI